MIHLLCLCVIRPLRRGAPKFAMVRSGLPGYQGLARNMAEKVGSG